MESLLRVVALYAVFPALPWRLVFRGAPPLCDHAFEIVEPLTQLRFLSRYLLLPVAKRWGRSARTTKHPHHLLAIQKKIASATAPKIISGKVRATPICNH